MISPSNFQQLPTNMHPFVQTTKVDTNAPRDPKISVPHQAVHSENVLIIKAQRGKNVSTSVFFFLIVFNARGD